MPKYYFDTERGASRYHDVDGIDLPSVEAARQELANLLRDLTFDDPSADLGIEVSAQVRCEHDVVLRGTCTLAVRHL